MSLANCKELAIPPHIAMQWPLPIKPIKNALMYKGSIITFIMLLFVIFKQNTVALFVQIRKLLAFYRPKKYTNGNKHKQYGNGDQNINYAHNFNSLSELQITIIELADMPMTAIHGATNPSAASGNIEPLYNKDNVRFCLIIRRVCLAILSK